MNDVESMTDALNLTYELQNILKQDKDTWNAIYIRNLVIEIRNALEG